jgi:hypothetical protein
VKERCHGKRYVVPPQGASAYGSIASRARKTVASRFYRFRMGKTRTGPYLTMLDRQKTTSADGTAAALLRPTNTRSSTAAGGRTNGSPCGGTLAKQLERAGSGRPVTPLWHSSSATKDAPQPSWSSSHKRRWAQQGGYWHTGVLTWRKMEMTVGRNTGMEELALSARMAWGRM